jgi:hypothetical protein
MSMSNVPADDVRSEDGEPAEGADMSDPEQYGGLSVEDDPDGTVDPGELAGGADATDEDVS